MTIEAAEPGFILRAGPARPETPVLITVPHAGRDYPLALRSAAACPIEQLAALEDRHADRLVELASARGFTTFVAKRARGWIDLNRDEREVDPAMIDPPPARHLVRETDKVRGGLGLVPRRLPGGGEIWRRRIDAEDLATRIREEHRPWHDAIHLALAERRATFGAALLLECHSMPPLRRTSGGPPPQLVIGDRYGRSAGAVLVDRIAAVTRAHGISTAFNAPYAGGHALERHGLPQAGVHAIQIELDRSLYLASDMRSPGAGLTAAQALVLAIAQALDEELRAAGLPLAAE